MKPMALNSKTAMTMRTLTIHIRRALRIALCILLVQALARPALPHTATNNCGYNAGNEYPVGLSCSYSTFNKPSTFTNNANPGGCNSSANDDAWGWFTATSNNTIITFDPSTSTDPVLHLLTGACGSLSVVACADDFRNPQTASFELLHHDFHAHMGTQPLGIGNAEEGKGSHHDFDDVHIRRHRMVEHAAPNHLDNTQYHG